MTMKLTLVIVGCVLFAAVHSAVVVRSDPNPAYHTDGKRSDMEISIEVPQKDNAKPTKERTKAILQQAQGMLQKALDDVDGAGAAPGSSGWRGPVYETNGKRDAFPEGWPIWTVGKRGSLPDWDLEWKSH